MNDKKMLLTVREAAALMGLQRRDAASPRCVRLRVSDIEQWIGEMVVPVREVNR